MSIHSTARARSRPQLVTSGVGVERGGRLVLTDISIAVTTGTRLGVVGENGRGKSTLLHVLAGRLPPDAGEVTRIGSLGIAEQEMTVERGRTIGDLVDIELADTRAAMHRLDAATSALAESRAGADVEYAAALDDVTALDAWDADRRVDIALQELGAITDRSRRLTTMSVGERYRVRLACLLGAHHDFLLLDEPTNHLDQHGLEFLTDALRSTKSGVVLVSHDRALLADVATHVLDLDPSIDGRPRLYGNGYAGYLEGRTRERVRWEQAYERHQVEQARLADDLSTAQNRLQAGWRPPKGTGKHQRATRAPSLVRAVNRRLDNLHAHDVTKPVPPLQFRLPELPTMRGVTLLHAEQVTVTNRLATPVTVELSSGDRLLVTGPNGSGKSTLLAVLAGHLHPDHGHARLAADARVGLVAQESPSADRRTARDVYRTRLYELLNNGLTEAETVSLRSLGLLQSADLARPVAELSMGQQRRLDLALALAARPHLLLLDEPTNHLSIALVDELTQALDTTPAAVVIVTHDRQLRHDLQHWPTIALPQHPRHRE
jgi:macrolide transport system ATP-binding/permease protein